MDYPLGSAEWIDERGRYFRVQLLDEDPAHGYIIGPPLELWDRLDDVPEALRTRIHNELYYRGILTEDDAARNGREVESALKSAFRLDVGRIREAYRGDRYEEDR
jgi:hypothetical protein